MTSQTTGTGTGGKPPGPLPSLLLVLTVVTAGRALLVLHAGTAPALGLATGLLAMVTAGAALAVRRPGPWRAG